MTSEKNESPVPDSGAARSVNKFDLLGCANCMCGGLANNVAARRLLGLCPLLALTHSLLKALTIGFLLLLVGLLSACLCSLLRATIFWRFKPIYFALLASISTIIVVNGAGILFPLLIDTLGVYALLLAANCLVIAQLQEVAEHSPLPQVASRVASDGAWMMVFLAVIATVRELGAYGRVFHDIAILNNLPVLNELTPGFSILAEPAGAFFVLALLLALINWYHSSRVMVSSDLDDKPDVTGGVSEGNSRG